MSNSNIKISNEFERIIKNEELFFKHAKGMRDIIGKEIHTYNEILFFIEGDTEFISESGRIKLIPYTTVVIPKETFHQFIVTGDNADYIRCVFNFESVLGLDEIINSRFQKIVLFQDNKIKELFTELQMLAKEPYNKLEADILLKALFAQILVYMKEDTDYQSDTYSFFSPTTEATLSYINQNLRSSLSIPLIASELHISESHLAHIFKKEMNISIHKYILEKRLFLANKKILTSTPPLQAAMESGFNDYSGFYIQFKKRFGISPSQAAHKKIEKG